MDDYLLKKKFVIKPVAVFLFTIVTIAVAILPISGLAKQNTQLASHLNAMILTPNDNKLSHLNIGVMVQSLPTGKLIYQHHANYLFTPASVQKLFTASAALLYLKPTYRFITSILYTGQIQNHVLTGNVYFKFTGDPEFKLKNLRRMVQQLSQRGITKIIGHLYIDNRDYSSLAYPPGWIWDDLSYSFAAPLNAIIINRNKFLLHFIPNQTLGKQPRLDSKLPKGIVTFHNYMITTAHHRKHCPITIYSAANNVYSLHGCLSRRSGIQCRSLAIRDINRYTKARIKQLLINDHINYSGVISLKKAPLSSHILAIHYSPTLTKIVKQMLKDSDNLTTDSLLNKLGEVYFRSQGNWQNGLRALKKILAPVTHINFKNNLINDGAGLSRYNLITPRQLEELLFFIAHNKLIKKPLINALPIAGIDGTLKERMRNLAHGQRVRAKTGSMTGTNALAGYIKTKHNGLLGIVIMTNNFVGTRKPVVRLENKICTYLVNARNVHHG